MKRFIRLLLLAGVLGGLAAWLKELLAQAEPPGETAARNGAGNGGAPTRDELYEEAQRLEIKGRSKMSKQELERAIDSART